MEEKKIIYSQPYEVRVKVVEKQNAKGDLQPEAEINISRKLESGDNIEDTIIGDVDMAVKRVKAAVRALQQLEGI